MWRTSKPPKNTTVLVYDEGMTTLIGTPIFPAYLKPQPLNVSGTEWVPLIGKDMVVHPTHWMPLPKTPTKCPEKTCEECGCPLDDCTCTATWLDACDNLSLGEACDHLATSRKY